MARNFSEDASNFWTDAARGKKLEMTSKQFMSRLIIKEVPGKEVDELMEFMEISGHVKDNKITLQDYLTLCGNLATVEAVRRSRKLFDQLHFVPAVKKAILIGNKSYLPESNMKDLASADNDVGAMYDYLMKKCNFERKDIEQHFDADEATLKKVFADARDKWAKPLTSGEKMQKGLLVVYYSGHGMLGNNVTNIICPDGKLFPLPLVIHCANKKNSAYGVGISTLPNVMCIVIMDCCRVAPKGGVDEEEPIDGQYYIYYAVQPGVAASTDSSPGAISTFTREVLDIFDKEFTTVQKIQFPDALDKLRYSEKGSSMRVDLTFKPKKKL